MNRPKAKIPLLLPMLLAGFFFTDSLRAEIVPYFKLGGSLSYFNLGNEFEGVFKQLENTFGGNQLNLSLATFNPTFSMQTDQPVARTKTNFFPTLNLAFGVQTGAHRFEFDTGLAGLVPLNTINLNTQMTLTEAPVNCSGGTCPMAQLGFVDPATHRGQYSFQMTMNEDVWIVTPSLSYEHRLFEGGWGNVSGGFGAGAMILSTKQRIAFSARRLDAPADAYGSRVLQGSGVSGNTADIGPLLRLFLGYRLPVFRGYQAEVRLGGSYGFVYLNRSVEGSSQAILGNTLAASFPLSDLGFKNRETDRFEMIGAFISAGMVF
jgi:hypothetical protein